MDLAVEQEITERKVKDAKSCVIISHRNPDGDAIGSSMGMKNLLINLGLPSVSVLFPSEYPANLNWIEGLSDSLIYDQASEHCILAVQNADVIFCLDFNDLSRIDKLGEVVGKSQAFKIMIDHHLNPGTFADFTFNRTSASSTCELIYEFAHKMGWGNHLDERVAESLYIGLLTDTGSFAYSVTPYTFQVAAELLSLGIMATEIQNKLFNSLEEKNLRLLGYCLYEAMEILEAYHTAIIVLSKEDYKRFNIQRGDTEGIVNYALKLHQVKMAILVMEQPSIVKISFRSKGNHSVERFAREQFKGGGHPNASGGQSFLPLKTTIKKMKELLPLYAPN
jgi:bifunctional oligoribonuclease and PAP phosphatase NrnA